MSVKLSGVWGTDWHDFLLYEPARTGQAFVASEWRQVEVVGVDSHAFLIHWWPKTKKGLPGKRNECVVSCERVIVDE